MNDIDKNLIKKCKNGDVNAFEKLISTHQKKVFNICYRYLSNYDDALELSQEIFIKIFKSISSFKEESSISTWIYRIATTTCIDELRKRKNQKIVSIEKSKEDDSKTIEFIAESANPHEIFESKEIRNEIQNAINELSEEFKVVIILRDIQGFSYNEIAKILDIPLGTIKSRIKRGREYIKNYLLDKGNFFKEASSN